MKAELILTIVLLVVGTIACLAYKYTLCNPMKWRRKVVHWNNKLFKEKAA
jgi:hypothetical protein